MWKVYETLVEALYENSFLVEFSEQFHKALKLAWVAAGAVGSGPAEILVTVNIIPPGVQNPFQADNLSKIRQQVLEQRSRFIQCETSGS